jgi:hypothetical protein
VVNGSAQYCDAMNGVKRRLQVIHKF